MKKAYFISNEKWNIDEVDYTERTYVQIIKEGIKRAKDNKQEFAAIVIEDTDYSDPFFAIAPVRNANALAIFDPTELSEYHSKWNSADSPANYHYHRVFHNSSWRFKFLLSASLERMG